MDPHYQEQLRFLLDGGQAMAKAFPRAADRLAARGFDPDVERLLEGIAYITGKIEEKHDHSFPEICQLMFDILFPHYLCPLPSLAVVELGGEACRVPRGTALESVAVMDTACRFVTAADVDLWGLELEDVGWRGRGRSIQLTLQLVAGPEALAPRGIDSLRLHLHGEPLLTRSLFHWLLTRLESLEVLDAGGRVVASTSDVRLRLQPLGYAEDEALFPWPFGSFPGFRLLLEYFALPQKFLFLDLELGELLANLPPVPVDQPERFALRFNLRVDAGRSLVVTRQNIRLGCTPAVNLFPHSADPIQRDPRRADFLVRPAGPHLHYQVYQVQRVSGWSPKETIHYPLLSELDLEQASGAFCQIFRREVDEEVLTYLSVHDGGRSFPGRQTLLCDLLCSNGDVPLGLHVGDACRPEPPFDGLRCQFITPLTPPVAISVGSGLRWRLVKHLALAQRELTSLEALRDAITLYNFPATADGQLAQASSLLLRGMLRAETRLSQHQHQRLPVWGHSTQLTIDGAAFDSEAELYLLGCVLNEYVALQAPINTFSELSILETRSQEVYRWPKRLGSKLLTP